MLEKVSIIEKAIQTLDAGTFQKLCDEIVSKKNIPIIQLIV